MTHRSRRTRRRVVSGAMVSIEASLRTVQSTVLAIAGLVVAGVLAAATAGYELATTGQLGTGAIVILVAGALACTNAAIIGLLRSAGPRTNGLVGVVTLDALAVVFAGVSQPTESMHPALGLSTVLLLLACLATTTGFSAAFCRIHTACAAALGAILAAGVPDGRPLVHHVFDATVVIGVLGTSTFLVTRVSSMISQHLGELRELALADALTGTLNRRGLTEAFATLIARAHPDDPVGIVMVDIDHFKWFNDQYGHDTGDVVLQRVGEALRAAAGPDDLVCRTGGEELAVVVRGQAGPVAEAIRRALAHADSHRVTASMGVVDTTAGWLDEPHSLWRLLDAADMALYEAKSTGRDRICTGEFHEAAPVVAREVREPRRAAVAPTEDNALTPSPHLPGWTLLGFSGVCLVWSAGSPNRASHAALAPIATALIFAAVVVGVILVGTTPLFEHFRWLAGILGSDVVVILMLLQVVDTPSRIVALFPLTLTGLMGAQRWTRWGLAAHHMVVAGACALAALPEASAPAVTTIAAHAAAMIGAAELVSWLRARNDRAAADLHRWSVTDPLTGLVNRHGLEIAFSRLSTADQLAVLAVDVDDFKSINDRYGHAAGDEALISLAGLLQATAGDGAVVGRIGGDEFVVLAPGTQPSTLSHAIAAAVTELPLALSVSIGSAVAVPHRLRSLWPLVTVADSALIQAKRAHHTESETQPNGGRVVTCSSSQAVTQRD